MCISDLNELTLKYLLKIKSFKQKHSNCEDQGACKILINYMSFLLIPCSQNKFVKCELRIVGEFILHISYIFRSLRVLSRSLNSEICRVDVCHIYAMQSKL